MLNAAMFKMMSTAVEVLLFTGYDSKYGTQSNVNLQR